MSTASHSNKTKLSFEDRGYSYLNDPVVEQVQRQRCEFICPLPYLGFMRAHGAEAIEFLHAQLTNDLIHLPQNYSHLSGYCTPKGRLLCIFRIHYEQDCLLLQAHRDVIASTVERMRKYIMRAKVELDIDEGVNSFGVVGRDCSAALESLTGMLPAEQNKCSSARGLTIICHSAETPQRYQVIGKASDLDPLWNEVSGSLPLLGSWSWASMDIQQGLATVFPDTSEQFIPQMLNMDIVDGVSFDKGCYPGQEIVARMHYLGKLKTRMVLGNVDAPSPPVPGDKVYPVDGEQHTGLVVNAAPGVDGYDLLATARLENVERGALCLRNSSDYPIVLGQLPYPLHSPGQKQT